MVQGQRRSDETKDNEIVYRGKLEGGTAGGGVESLAQAGLEALRIYYGEFDPGSG